MTTVPPCPKCSGPIGDGDRATRGLCARCQMMLRRWR